MKDRVPLYPGRVRLTPVSGQENTYDMVRADEPTQEGTPLSKATFLKDSTAALFGLGGDAVPDDVLSEIKSVLNSQDNDIASKAKIATGSYVGTGTVGYDGSVELSFDFVPQIIVVVGATTNSGDTMFSGNSYFAVFHPLYFNGEYKRIYYIYNSNGAYRDLYAKLNGTTFYFYDTQSTITLNKSGYTYYYVALG